MTSKPDNSSPFHGKEILLSMEINGKMKHLYNVKLTSEMTEEYYKKEYKRLCTLVHPNLPMSQHSRYSRYSSNNRYYNYDNDNDNNNDSDSDDVVVNFDNNNCESNYFDYIDDINHKDNSDSEIPNILDNDGDDGYIVDDNDVFLN